MTDSSFLDYVLEQLSALRKITVRPMFGGHGLYLGGDFFGIVHKGALYLRTDEQSRSQYLKAGSRPFNPKGRQELHRYYGVPAAILDDAEQLCTWARTAAKSRD